MAICQSIPSRFFRNSASRDSCALTMATGCAGEGCCAGVATSGFVLSATCSLGSFLECRTAKRESPAMNNPRYIKIILPEGILGSLTALFYIHSWLDGAWRLDAETFSC